MPAASKPADPPDAPRVFRLDEFHPPDAPVALTIGNFDGVHAGHRRLIACARQTPLDAAATDAARYVAAITFDPHPAAILAPQRAPARLGTLAERCRLLGVAGADAVIVLESTPALFAMPALAFLEQIARVCRPALIVEGPSFRFGRGREGDHATLAQHAARLGYRVEVSPVEHVEIAGQNLAVSSSAIRAALARGEVASAAALLTRPHRLTGRVGFGAQRGAQFGFATANLEDVEQMIPAHAVYAALAQHADGRLIPAVVNIGPQPTFDSALPRVEAHLLDFSEDLRHQRLGLWLMERLRAQQRFADVSALVAQIEADIAAARRLLSASAAQLAELARALPI